MQKLKFSSIVSYSREICSVQDCVLSNRVAILDGNRLWLIAFVQSRSSLTLLSISISRLSSRPVVCHHDPGNICRIGMFVIGSVAFVIIISIRGTIHETYCQRNTVRSCGICQILHRAVQTAHMRCARVICHVSALFFLSRFVSFPASWLKLSIHGCRPW